MQVYDPAIKQSHVAKRLRIRYHQDKVTVQCDRIRQWIVLWLCSLGASMLFVYLTKLAGNSSSASYMIIAVVVGIADTVIIVLYLARGWRLVLDVEQHSCIWKRTYAWVPYQTRQVSFNDGPIGPCSARVLMLIVDKETPASVIGCLVLMLLGPLGLIIGLLMGLGRSAPSRSQQIVYLPAIFHFNEQTGESTVLLVMEKAIDRERVLQAFADCLPEHISTS